MVNLELYKIYVTVAKEQNITRASEELNISQPAVTKHIKNLENILETKLFERNNKGLKLTETGEKLYQKLKQPINEIIEIDKEFSKSKNITIGSHNHLLNKVFGESVNEFYLEYPDINTDLKCYETNKMLEMLEDKEIDIVFSKKVEGYRNKNIKYIPLGKLNDIFIINKNSDIANKVLTLEEIEKKIIYVPRKYAQTVTRLNELTKNKKLNLKNSSYNTILEITSKSDSIGLITKEYIEKEEFKKYNLVELKTELKLKPIEFGIYFNTERKKEVNCLIKIIREKF